MQSILFKEMNDTDLSVDVQSETEDNGFASKSGVLTLLRKTSTARDDLDINERSKKSICIEKVENPRKIRKVHAAGIENSLMSYKSDQLNALNLAEVASSSRKTAYGSDQDDDIASNYSSGASSSLFA